MQDISAPWAPYYSRNASRRSEHHAPQPFHWRRVPEKPNTSLTCWRASVISNADPTAKVSCKLGNKATGRIHRPLDEEGDNRPKHSRISVSYKLENMPISLLPYAPATHRNWGIDRRYQMPVPQATPPPVPKIIKTCGEGLLAQPPQKNIPNFSWENTTKH